MRKVIAGATFVAGLVVGLFGAQFLEHDALAQNNWQCMSWALDSGGNVSPVTNFLSGAKTVELTSSGLSTANRIALVACKQ